MDPFPFSSLPFSRRRALSLAAGADGTGRALDSSAGVRRGGFGTIEPGKLIVAFNGDLPMHPPGRGDRRYGRRDDHAHRREAGT